MGFFQLNALHCMLPKKALLLIFLEKNESHFVRDALHPH